MPGYVLPLAGHTNTGSGTTPENSCDLDAGGAAAVAITGWYFTLETTGGVAIRGSLQRAASVAHAVATGLEQLSTRAAAPAATAGDNYTTGSGGPTFSGRPALVLVSFATNTPPNVPFRRWDAPHPRYPLLLEPAAIVGVTWSTTAVGVHNLSIGFDEPAQQTPPALRGRRGREPGYFDTQTHTGYLQPTAVANPLNMQSGLGYVALQGQDWLPDAGIPNTNNAATSLLPNQNVQQLQTAAGRTGGGQTSVTATFGAPTTAGTLLVALVTSNSGATGYTAPAGWAAACAVQSGAGVEGQLFYYQQNPGSISGVAFGPSTGAASLTLTLWEFSGMPASVLVDSGALVAATGSGTAIAVTGNALGNTAELVFCAQLSNNALDTITAGTVYGQAAQGDNGSDSAVTAAAYSVRGAWRVTGDRPAAPSTGTASTSAGWLTFVVAFDTVPLVIANTAAGAVTLGNLTVGAAQQQQTAAGSVTLGSLVAAAAASEQWSAAGTLTLGNLVAGSAATETFSAAGAATLGDLVPGAAVGETFTAAAAATLGDLLAGGTAAETFTGAAAVVLGDLAVNATEREQAASGSVTLGDLVVDAAALAQVAAGTVTLGDLVAAGTGFEGFFAAGSVTLGDLTVAAVAPIVVTPAGAVTLGDLVVNALASEQFGAGSVTLGDLVVMAFAPTNLAAGHVTLGSLVARATVVEHLGPPNVSGVSPDAIGPLTLVTVTGVNFLTATGVTVGGAPTPFPPVIVSNTELRILVASPFYLSAGGEDTVFGADVLVTNDDGESPPNAPADQLTLIAPPVVTSLTPDVLSAADGSVTLTLTGRNFQTAFLLQLFDQDLSGAISVSPDGTRADVTLIADLATIIGVLGTGSYAAQFWNLAGPSAFSNQLVFLIGGAAFSFGAIDDALSGRYGPVVIRYRYERRRRDFSFIADITKAFIVDQGTTIHLDNDQAVARTADFRIRADQLPPGFTGSMVSGEAVAVWADVLVGGSTASFCLGLFHLDAPTKTQHPRGYEEWQAKGSDMTLVLANRATTAAYVVPAATNYAGAARALVSSFGLTLATWYALGGAPSTPVAFSWPPKTVYLQLLAELLFGINGYPVWADSEGRITTQPRVEPARNPPAVIYQEAAEPRMIVPPSTVTPQQTQFANYANVGIDNPGRPAYAASFTNADPSSAISTVASGRFEPLEISGSGSPSGKALLDGPTADAVAIYELQEEATRAVTRTLITKPDPRRTNREYYRLQLEGYEASTLWRVQSWDLQCWPGGLMTHTLGYAGPVAISSGAPSLTAIVGLLGSVAVGDVAPLAPGACTVRLSRDVPLGHTLLLVFMADQPYTAITGIDTSIGNVQTMDDAGTFGIAGSHPVAGGGEFTVFVIAANVTAPLVAGAAIGFTLPANTYFAAAAVWELVSAWLPGDGEATSGVASDAGGANTLGRAAPTFNGGLTSRTSFATDVIVGAVGAVWSTSDPTLAHTFTPDVGQGWTQALALPLPALSGVFPWLFVTLQVAQGAGQFTVSGSFDRPAAGFGAACVALRGEAAV